MWLYPEASPKFCCWRAIAPGALTLTGMSFFEIRILPRLLDQNNPRSHSTGLAAPGKPGVPPANDSAPQLIRQIYLEANRAELLVRYTRSFQ